MMNLVTGATGLVGSYLVKLLLSKGESVRAIKRSTSDLSLLGENAKQVEWVESDLLDITGLAEAMQGIERVYHCAAVISFLPSEVEYMKRVNEDGTANVMNAAMQAGVKKVIHVSSVAAFGLADNGKVIDEKHADPNIGKCFHYFRSKQYGEREAWRAHAEGLDVVVVCPGTIIGAGWWDDEPNSLFREIDNGLMFYTNATNGFVDVRDVVEIMYRLMVSNISGEKYIVVADNKSFKDVIWKMADALGVKRPAIEANAMLRAVAWRLAWIQAKVTGKRPLMTAESAALASISFEYNSSKIVNELQYNFIPINKCIEDTALAYLESKKNNRDWAVFY